MSTTVSLTPDRYFFSFFGVRYLSIYLDMSICFPHVLNFVFIISSSAVTNSMFTSLIRFYSKFSEFQFKHSTYEFNVILLRSDHSSLGKEKTEVEKSPETIDNNDSLVHFILFFLLLVVSPLYK